MNGLHRSKCLNHPDREAVACCPECKNFFCRECVTEHHGKLVCKTCLTSAASSEQTTSLNAFQKIMSGTGTLFKMVLSFSILWLTAYAFGRLLLLIPDSFHSGDIWESF